MTAKKAKKYKCAPAITPGPPRGVLTEHEKSLVASTKAIVFREVAARALKNAQYAVATNGDFESGMKHALRAFSEDLLRLARESSNSCPTRLT